MNNPLALFAATLFSWTIGYFYIRWSLQALQTDTKKLWFWIGPFEKVSNFSDGSWQHRLNTAFHWFQLTITFVIGWPITLIFMILMPWTFVRSVLQLVNG